MNVESKNRVKLDPENAAARELWCHMARGYPLSLYFLANVAQIAAKFDADEGDAMVDEIDNLLGRLQYGTTFDTFGDQFDHVRGNELKFWSGRYCLADQDGVLYTLYVSTSGAAKLRIGDDTLTGTELADGVLEMAGSKASARLVFDFAIPMENLAALEAADLPMDRNQPRCKGTMRIAERSLTVQGKRGCYSAEGVSRESDGDPAELWDGVYLLLMGDSKTWLDERLIVKAASDGAVAVTWGDVAADECHYSNNGVICDWTDAKRRLAARFQMDASGKRRLSGVLLEGAIERPFAGFLTDRRADPQEGAEATRQPDDPALGKLAAQENVTFDDTGWPEKRLLVTIDPSLGKDSSANAEAGTLIELPKGVQFNNYELDLVVSKEEVEWSLEKADKTHDKMIDITTAKRDSKKVGRLIATPAETWGFSKFVAKAGSKYYGFKLGVVGQYPMVISPTSLPDIVRTVPINIQLVAPAFKPGYSDWKWKYLGEKREGNDAFPQKDLPLGLKFDEGKAKLWTPNPASAIEIGESQRAYTLTVRTYYDPTEVLFVPVETSLPFTVKEPEQVFPTGLMDYVRTVLELGAGFLLLAQWAKHKLKDHSKDVDVGVQLQEFKEKSLEHSQAIQDQLKLTGDALNNVANEISKQVKKSVKVQLPDFNRITLDIEKRIGDLERENANLTEEIRRLEKELETASENQRKAIQDDIDRKERRRKKNEEQKRKDNSNRDDVDHEKDKSNEEKKTNEIHGNE